MFLFNLTSGPNFGEYYIEYLGDLPNNPNKQDFVDFVSELPEVDLRLVFDNLKEKYGRRALGKGYIYRIIDDREVFDIDDLTNEQKTKGINSSDEIYVRYDKGDRDGNKWLSDTPFLINWNKNSVFEYATSSFARNFSNNKYYFKPGFSWNIINGTRNTNNHKFKFIESSVNDVGGMKLSLHEYASNLVSDKFIVCICNSFLNNRLTEAFINFTVNFQMNDARQIPIIIPTNEQLTSFEAKFDECFEIQQQYFNGDLEKVEARKLLKPIELEIDEMVNKLYGITAEAEEIEETEEELELVDDYNEEEEDD